MYFSLRPRPSFTYAVADRLSAAAPNLAPLPKIILTNMRKTLALFKMKCYTIHTETHAGAKKNYLTKSR